MFRLGVHKCSLPSASYSARVLLFYSTKPGGKKTFPDTIKNDWIGPPDSESNLRLIKFHIPRDETKIETEYRLMREDVQNWNQNYWAKHNSNFVQRKELFIKERMSSQDWKTEDVMNSAIAQQMSEFYRKFLDENYQMHRDYNWEWYRRNVGLLWPAFKVYIQRLFKRKAKHVS